MLSQLKARKPDLNVEILGINGANFAGFNSLVVSERTLSWLQDTRMDNVWGRWNVRWRDVRIVDSQGQLQAVYNLTDFDLSNPQNFSDLEEIFVKIAKVTDSDGDHLPDDWEIRYFGNLSNDGAADPDADGYDNLAEFAFGSDPTNAESRPQLISSLTHKGSQPLLNLAFRRCAGNSFDFQIQGAPELGSSFARPATLVTQPPRNLFDGTGTVESAFSLPANAPEQFLRLRVLIRP